MKKHVALIAALSVAVLSGNAMAADSTNIVVSATVQGACKIQSGAPVTLSFGSIDPLSFADTNLEGGVTFWCTKNSPYSVKLNGTAQPTGTVLSRSMAGSGSNTLAYTLTTLSPSTGSGLGANNNIAYNVRSTLSASAVSMAPADTYSDTIAVAITP